MTETYEIRVSDFIKIVHNRERFWVSVTELPAPHEDLFRGIVDNDLLLEHGFGYGDEIEFHSSIICPLSLPQ